MLTDVDMLLTIEKGIRGEICHAIHSHAEAINKYMRDYNEDGEKYFYNTKMLIMIHNDSTTTC